MNRHILLFQPVSMTLLTATLLCCGTLTGTSQVATARQEITFQANAQAATQNSANVALPAEAPWERAVFQRGGDNFGRVLVAHVFKSPVAVLEASAEVMPGETGQAVDWTPVAKPNAAKASGFLRIPAGGWYRIKVRGKDARGALVEEFSVERVGVGEVFYLAGQSNMQGSNASTPAKDDHVSEANYAEGTPLEPLGFSRLEGPVGPALGGTAGPSGRMADLLTQELKVPILIIQAAQGGTSVAQWVDDSENSRYLTLKKALQFWTPILGGARAVLWHQGEQDGGDLTPQYIYANRLKSVIQKSRIDSGIADLPWLVARATALTANNPKPRITNYQVEMGQTEVVKMDPLVYAGPLTDDLQRGGNDVHYIAPGQLEHGNRWFTRVKAAFFDKPVVSLAASSAQIKEGEAVTFTVYRTGLTTAPLVVKLQGSGTATKTADYEIPASLTIAKGAASASFTVRVADDIAPEGDETLSISPAEGEGYVAKQVDPIDRNVIGGTTGFINASEAVVTIAASDAATREIVASQDASVKTDSKEEASTLDGTGPTGLVQIIARSKTSDEMAMQSRFFVQFDLSSIKEPIVGAKLRLYGTPGAPPWGDSDQRIEFSTEATWTEKNLTWQNQPQNRTPVAILPLSEAKFLEVDVTPQVQAATQARTGAISFTVSQTAGRLYSAAKYNTRENAQNKPTLVLYTAR